MKFIFRRINDTYVVWFAKANRFMHLQEPAFRVFEDWCNQVPEEQISWNCADEFQLSEAKARCFVSQIICRLEKLPGKDPEKEIIVPGEMTAPPEDADFKVRYYQINATRYRFRYGNEKFEELFHPGLESCISDNQELAADHNFDLFTRDDQLILQTDNFKSWKCPESRSDYYPGLVYLQLSNCINQCTDDFWMATVHASAVTSGRGAVLFSSAAGNGKSTFAALLMKQGYQVISDDFVPVSLHQPKVYPCSGDISIKNRSFKLLNNLYPDLVPDQAMEGDVSELFLPLNRGGLPAPKPAKAFVFLQYDPEVQASLKQLSSLDMMDRLLREFWLPPKAATIDRFMDWYFSIPCYLLNYSDTQKAIAAVMKQFEK